MQILIRLLLVVCMEGKEWQRLKWSMANFRVDSWWMAISRRGDERQRMYGIRRDSGIWMDIGWSA
jgi:hypothetical protein